MSRFYTTKKDEIVYKKITPTPWGKEYLLECLLPKGTECFGTKSGSSKSRRKNRAQYLVPIAIYEGVGTYINSRSDELRLLSKKTIRHCGFYSAHSITYTLGQTAKPSRAFSTRPMQCASGIHFFYKVDDALNWS